MVIYKTPDNSLHDDMGGAALSNPAWPQDAILISDEEAAAIRGSNTPQPTLQERIDAECRKEGLANEIMLEGLLAGMYALGLLNGKTMQQLAEENAAFKKGLELRTLFAQWRAEAQP